MINLNIIESLENIKEADKIEEAKKFASAAQNYVAQGMDEEMTAELLHIDGCSPEIAEELARCAHGSLPSNYTHEEPPESYSDVKSKVEETIRRASSDPEIANLVKLYFDKYAKPQCRDLKDAILVAGLSDSTEIFLNDLHRDLSAFVEGIMLSNAAAADGNIKIASSDNEREQMEYVLFGIWPVGLIQKHAQRKRVEKEILDRSFEDK